MPHNKNAVKRIESAHRSKQSVNSASQFRGDSYLAGADDTGGVVAGYEGAPVLVGLTGVVAIDVGPGGVEVGDGVVETVGG